MKSNICFIGIGNMGGGIVDIVIQKNLWPRNRIILCDIEERKLDKYAGFESLKLFTDPVKGVTQSRIIVVAVKPQDSQGLFQHIKPALKPASLIISIMAGVSIETICSGSGCQEVIRTMPNLPVILGKGMIGWSCSPAVKNKVRMAFQAKIKTLGKGIYFPGEEILDRITALSGSGPAYIAFLALSLTEAGMRLGLTETEARMIAIQTITGASLILDQLAIQPEVLIRQIASKGGTTEQALKVFEKHQVKNIIVEAVEAAYTRAKGLGDPNCQKI